MECWVCAGNRSGVGSMMACVDFVESVAVSEGFIDCPSYCTPPTFGWLSPRISFSKDFIETEIEAQDEKNSNSSSCSPSSNPHLEDQEQPGMEDNNSDFEFCLSLPDDPLTMLPADELFYQGKLMPLQFPSRSGPLTNPSPRVSWADGQVFAANTTSKTETIPVMSSSVDPLSVSPKAPKCSSRWKELLGLKKLQTPKQLENRDHMLSLQSPQPHKTSLPSKAHLTPKSLKQLFRGSDSKSSPTSDLSNQPLLIHHQSSRDSDADSSSARLSVSSSGAADLEDLPRLSLDSEKGNPNPIRVPLRVNVRKPRCADGASEARCRVGRSPYRVIDSKLPPRGSSVDSPRMNSSGKIVFHSLERSCSSPSSFNGSLRNKDLHHRNLRQKENWRGMERSYSANVRVTPVLNVPVCSLRASKGAASSKGTMFGFGQLFSPQKKDGNKHTRNPSLSSSSTSSSNPPRREG